MRRERQMGVGWGFVQSIIDWKCKPESVQRGDSSDGKEMVCVGRGGGSRENKRRERKEGRTSELVRIDRWPLVSTTAPRNSPIGKTAFRLNHDADRYLVPRPDSTDCSLNLTPVWNTSHVSNSLHTVGYFHASKNYLPVQVLDVSINNLKRSPT